MSQEDELQNLVTSEWSRAINGKLEEMGILGDKRLNLWVNERYQALELEGQVKLMILPPRAVVDPGTGEQVVWWAFRQLPEGTRLTPLSEQQNGA